MIWQKKLSFLSLFCLFSFFNFFLFSSPSFAQMYTYSGSHQLINDGGGTYRIKFLTNGTFIPVNSMTIDVFLVGGGGRGGSIANGKGGGGGYTSTYQSISLSKDTGYSVSIGSGSVSCYGQGGTSSAFGHSVLGGYSSCSGGNGGSGGGGGNGNGGSNGSNGLGTSGGIGQNTTTREFGEITGTLYAGGGGGNKYGAGGAGGGGSYGSPNGYPGTTNLGGGGGYGDVSNGDTGGNGGSGIVVIRFTDSTAPTCGTWSPVSSPWKNSGTSTFSLSSSTDAGGSGIFTGVGSCTTGSANGATCTVTISDVAGNTTTCTSPVNRVDATAPTCGTWSPSASPWKVSGAQGFTLSGSTDAGGSGINVEGGSCTTGSTNGTTCTVTISDVAGNTRVCTSPVNRVDGDLPVISNVEKVIGEETATITWETNEQTYSKVKYGLTSSLGVETSLSTSLSINAEESLTGLLSCTNYSYQPTAVDVALNEESGEIGNFTTLGCGVQNDQEGETEASISAQVSNSFANDEGGSLELETETEQIRLDLPVNLHASSGANLLVFQIKQLVKEQVIEETGVPENENKLINSIFDLKAYLNTDERLAEFDEPIMISLSYTDEQVAGIDLSTLSIYRYDGVSWIKLETTVDQVNKRFIAYTNHFSLFAAFGQETVPTNDSVSSDNSSSSSSSSSNNDQGTDCSSSKPVSVSDLFQINASKTSAKLYFTPQSDTSQYFISFSSQNTNAEEHGEQVTLLSEGVQSHTIYYLKPNTNYYLKVRGQNGCAPGNWSNILKFKTNEKIYYRDAPSVSFVGLQ